MLESKNVDIKTFASVVGVSVATINRKLNEFSHLRIGSRVLFNEESVESFNKRFTKKPKTNQTSEGK